ncbi:MAG TPA: ArgE/DapE family deacylase [Gaiellaceae bacterium]|nr:ArgE/DapE family deacylase [Gaiellaceae bacterium]
MIESPDLQSDAIIAFARDLVAIPTENPPGAGYEQCVARIAEELEHLRISYEIVETGDEHTARQTIVSHPAGEGSLLYLHGHYDVVPAFSPEQFAPRTELGRLTGRGSSDMKGGLAAIVYAAGAAAKAGARVGLVIVPDEETGGRLGSERLAELGLIDASAAGAIVAEPTWGTIWHACRGAFTLRVTVHGRAAHVGLHYDGSNAFTSATDLVQELRTLEHTLQSRESALTFGSPNPRARESIMLIGGVADGGTNFNIVPDRFSFTIDRRPNPDEDYDAARRELLGLLDVARTNGLNLEWEVLQDAVSAVTPPDHDFVDTVATAIADVTGNRPLPTCCPGVLETRIYSRLGIPAVAFGPGLIDKMHSPDEDVPAANLSAAARIYAAIAKTFIDWSPARDGA